MILYHGTNQNIDSIDFAAGSRFKDFGQGFYLTPDKETAERMAKKKASLFGGVPTVISYEFNKEAALTSKISIKEFPKKATAEWIRFIADNRDRKQNHPVHKFDIVIGPIADDGVVLQLTNYQNRILSPEEAAARLQDRFLDQQYYFGSSDSLLFLKKNQVWTLD